MTMKLYFLRQTALDMMKRDIQKNLEYYSGSQVWLDDYFLRQDVSSYYFDSGIEIPDFELLPGDAETDAANAKILYESLKGKLNRLQATDFRLWSYLTHITCWKYMKARWALEEDKKDSWLGRISDRYFIASRSPYMRNGVSRLYWSAELTYDETNSNPYEYLAYVLKWQDLAVGALERQIGRARDSLLGNLQALKESELNEEDRRLFFTKINQYGGISLLDSISREKSLEVSRRYIEYIQSLPIVENGSVMKYNVENGRLKVGKAEIRTTDRLLRRRVGAIIEINKAKWQIVEVS